VQVAWLWITRRVGKIAAIVADWMRWMLSNMSELPYPCTWTRRCSAGKKSGFILRDAPVVIIATLKKGIAWPRLPAHRLTYLELAATSMGLGCCWAGYFNAAATNFPQ